MTQPGWYPDPSSPYLVRWWDGQRWTSDTHPGAFQAPGYPAAGFRPDAAADAAEEAKSGVSASKALLFGAIAYSGQFLVDALVLGPIWRAYRHWIDAVRTNNTATLTLPRGAVALNAVSSLASVVLLIVAVMFLIWFHKAATVAAHAGIPARRSPGWAVGSWFIPIVNFWFPYQSAIDLFPPGHPGRQMVKKWWIMWLAMSFSAYFVFIGALIATALGLAMALVACALAFGAAFAAKAVIDEVNRSHAALVRR